MDSKITIGAMRTGSGNGLATWTRRLCWFMLTLLAIGPVAAWAENFQVRSWYAEDGLPNNTITALAQTPDGCLWIGTPKGLVRFDGDSFKPIAANYPGTLEDSNVVGLVADHAGSLWIASASGLITQFSTNGFHVRYRPAKAAPNDLRYTGLRFVDPDSTAENWRNLGSLFAVAGNGDLWAATITGEIIHFTASNQPVTVSLTNCPAGQILGLVNDPAGRVWMLKGTNACLAETGGWKFFNPASLQNSGKIFCAATTGGFWAAKNARPHTFVSRLEKDGGEWNASLLSIPENSLDYPVSTLLQDRRERLWLAVPTEGIYVKSPGGDWSRVQMKGPLAKCVVRCLFEDSRGGIWVGTQEKGLHQILDPLVQMVMLPASAADVHATTVGATRDGSIWIGTDKGLYRQKPGESETISEVREFHRQNVYTILEDSRTNLWVGTKNGIFLRQSSEFKKILTLTNNGVLALYQDRKGDVWAGGFQGMIFHFHDGTNDLVCQPDGKNDLSICCLTEDDQGGILAVTRWLGVWRVQGKQLVKVESVDPQMDANARSDAIGRVCAVLCDPDQVLWFGTFGNGLFRWSNGKMKQFMLADGLPDNGILGLQADGQGNLWLSSRNGIFGCSYRQLNNYVRNQTAPLVCMQLGADEGLADRECTGAGQPVIACGPDGRFWVATTVGAAGFDPAAITKIVSTPEVMIENLNVDGHLMAGINLRIPASARHFEFQYSAPELIAPKKLHFRYRLEGLDQTWTDAGTSRMAVYNRLLAGRYRFRVMVCGEDGIWREAKNFISLRVIPPFWQTWWFQALLLTGIIILITGGVALQIRRKMQRSLERLETQRAVEAVRQRITRDLHDELGSAITEILQAGDLTLQPKPEPEILRQKLKAVMNLSRQLSVTVSEITWTMSSRNDTLPSLVGYISNHAQEFFHYSNISCRLDVTKNLPPVMVSSQARHNLFLAVKEALNNVAKHSGASEVILRAHYAGPVLQISIEDNGRGFDGVTPSLRGEGLANMRERLKAIKGETVFTSTPGGGTTIRFILDLNQNLNYETVAS